jgi:hypothetical protein
MCIDAEADGHVPPLFEGVERSYLRALLVQLSTLEKLSTELSILLVLELSID